jgi:hypothetical protein
MYRDGSAASKDFTDGDRRVGDENIEARNCARRWPCDALEARRAGRN